MTGGLFDDLVTNANNSNSGSNVQNYEEPDTMSSGGLFSDLVPPQKGSPKTSPVQNLQDRSFFDNFLGKFNSSVADVAGFPFDTFPETLGKAASKLTGEETPKGSYGSDWVKNKFNEIGIDTSYAPNSYGAAASNNMLAAAAAVPVGRVMKGLKYLGPATNLVRKIGSALSDSPVTNIVSSIPMSMGGHLASNSAPDEYKPLADFAGQLATGAGLSAIGSGAEVGLSALIKAYKSARPSKIDVAGVKVSKDRAAAVGKDILSSASNPEYVRQQLGLTDTAPAQPFVYGSKPTLAETMVDPTQEGNVGDVGISNWERNLAQQSTGKGKFLARLNQQHNAQLEQINEVGGEGGGVDLSNLFKQKRETLEDQTNKEIQDLLSNAQKSSSSLGGEYPPDLRANLQSAINAHNAKEDTLWNPFMTLIKIHQYRF